EPPPVRVRVPAGIGRVGDPEGRRRLVKAVSSGVRVAILFLLVAIGGGLGGENTGPKPARPPHPTRVSGAPAGAGLAQGSARAGLPKGEVTGLEVDGRYAKVTFKLDDEIGVYTSGVIIKKASSLLGDNYLEIDPGEQVKRLPDGTKKEFTLLGPTCKTYNDPD